MIDAVLVGVGKVIGKPPGWERLVRAIAPPKPFPEGGPRERLVADGYRFLVDRGTLVGWTIHLFGAYEPEVREQIRAVLQPGDVAIDVGANVGWHALLMAQRVGARGRVYAFEPNPTTRERLVAAISANRFDQVIVEPRAAADVNGRKGFTAPDAGDIWDGTGRLLDPPPTVVPDPPRIAAPTAHHTTPIAPEHTSVDCVRLDDFVVEHSIARVALIKIDVEGWELSVLRGAPRVLRESRPVVLFEFDPTYVSRCGGSAADLNACLAAADYQLFRLDPRAIPQPVNALGSDGGNFMARPREFSRRPLRQQSDAR